MVKPLGGRGKKAPYDTTQMRVPIPLKSRFESAIADYREKVLLGEDDNEPEDSEEDESEPSDAEVINLQHKKIQELMSEVKYLEFKLSHPSAIATKLVDRFIDEIEQADKLHTRNNVNLVRFRNWLQNQANSDPDL